MPSRPRNLAPATLDLKKAKPLLDQFASSVASQPFLIGIIHTGTRLN
jgi:hypothetical protein